RFRRPACVIAWEESGFGTGSLRSVDGIDIGAAVRAAVEAGHLTKGGGHAMAAGLTVERTSFDALQAFLRARLGGAARASRAAHALAIDGALTPAAVNDEFVDLMDRAGPYGQGNPQPRFAFPAHRVKFAKTVGEAHVRCVLEAGDGSRLDAVAFRVADQPLGAALLASSGMPLHVAGHLRRDTWAAAIATNSLSRTSPIRGRSASQPRQPCRSDQPRWADWTHQAGCDRAIARLASCAVSASVKMPKHVGPLPDMAAIRHPGSAPSAALISAMTGRRKVAAGSRSLPRSRM